MAHDKSSYSSLSLIIITDINFCVQFVSLKSKFYISTHTHTHINFYNKIQHNTIQIYENYSVSSPYKINAKIIIVLN